MEERLFGQRKTPLPIMTKRDQPLHLFWKGNGKKPAASNDTDCHAWPPGKPQLETCTSVRQLWHCNAGL